MNNSVKFSNKINAVTTKAEQAEDSKMARTGYHDMETQAGPSRHQQPDELSQSIHFSEKMINQAKIRLHNVLSNQHDASLYVEQSDSMLIHQKLHELNRLFQQQNQDILLQQRQNRQRSQELREQDMLAQAGLSKHRQRDEWPPSINLSESSGNDIFLQCQEQLNEINACAVQRQMNRDEMIEQVKQSLDDHQQLMKSVPAQSKEKTQPSSPKLRQNTQTTVLRLTDIIKGVDHCPCISFLQASKIFERIRNKRMKLLTSFERYKEKLNETQTQLNQVKSKIGDRSKLEKPEWIILQYKNCHILLTDKELLVSLLLDTRELLNLFLYDNKDNMLKVLNVFNQHRVRCETALRQNSQLLKAASVLDINDLRNIIKNVDLKLNADTDPSSVHHDACTASQMDAPTISEDTENDDENATLKLTIQNHGSPQLTRNKQVYMSKTSTPEQIDTKLPTDFGVVHSQNITDFKCIRASDATTNPDTCEASKKNAKSSVWSIIKNKVKRFF